MESDGTPIHGMLRCRGVAEQRAAYLGSPASLRVAICDLDGLLSFWKTLGPWGPEARALFKELSKRVIESTGDPRAGSYLGQRIRLAIQRGNAASILGTVPRCGGFEDVLDFI
ncbi:jg9256 [Pararge aegeria aegeria]|uniref:Jg9256 protein n=1 Tax=Pararge aegeria aegeria TaxID=348720 RepID=A0A8S4SFS1_9NEOP|nr:jg9256 [Pararge aegeria aegeria]